MRQQLIDLRNQMREYDIDAYLVPTTDFHGSEYVNDYFKCRKFISGFTGSAGTLLVTAEKALLWVDGRYFIQAAAQLAGSGIDLMKSGEPGVPEIQEYLESALAPGSCLGFDGRVVDCATGKKFAEKFRLRIDLDLAGKIWADRPAIKPSAIYALPEAVTGETHEAKLSRLRAAMKEKGASFHLMTKLEEIAWLFNLRGDDVANTPVFYAFALITPEDSRLYVMDESFTGQSVFPYLQIFDDLAQLPEGKILLDENIVSYALAKSLPETVTIVNGTNPAEVMKALKNPVEIACTRNAHIKDGAAMVNFIYWLKTNIGRIPMTEISASDYAENCRRAQEGFFDLSFASIAGYEEHAALPHYFATEESDKTLRPEGFFLLDSGGQYSDGTTDITRTFALGPLTEEMKRHYTLVLRSHIALATASFAAGTTGLELDVAARGPLLEAGLNFNHGTGHGVGHILSVHEGPQKIAPQNSSFPFYPGMISSNEPGVYIEGSHGVRLENEILCVEKPDGRYAFETITFCPFDRDAILPELMTEEELSWLNSYHSAVYEKLSPLLEEPQRAWLAEATAEISR